MTREWAFDSLARSSLFLTEETTSEESDVKTAPPTHPLDDRGRHAAHSSERPGRRGSAGRRVLVAGSTGYAGSFVCRELAGRGHFVRALARSPQKLAAIRDSLDEIVEARITRRGELERVCNGIDVVFSSAGITRQKDGLTFRDVDDQGNKNLLDVALGAGVGKFVYISVANGPRLRHLDIIDAHEAFVEELEASGIDDTVVRPTGYFSDASGLFEMARRGRVWLIGPGTSRLNPIHGADLAKVCADAVEGASSEIAVGGPQTMTWREIVALSFDILDRPARISSIPEWLVRPAVRVTRLFNRHQGEFLAFFVTVTTTDAVAPSTGTHTLEEQFRELARARTGRPFEPEHTRERPTA